MTETDIQIVRDVVEAVTRSDFDLAVSLLAPDAEVDMSRAVGINAGVYTRDEFRRVSEEFNSSWESERYETGEIVEAGDHVLVPWTNHLRGRDGIEVRARGVWVATLRDGVIVRLCLYQELDEALADVGPS